MLLEENDYSNHKEFFFNKLKKATVIKRFLFDGVQ